jgi:hypothetical protein
MAAVSADDVRRFSSNLGTGMTIVQEATDVNLFAVIGA